MQKQLAPSKQAEQSLDLQTIEVPADLRLAAITNPAIIALCRLEGGGLIEELGEALLEVVKASYNLTKKEVLKPEEAAAAKTAGQILITPPPPVEVTSGK